MKNVFLALFVFIALTVTQAFAYNMKDFTNDAKIMSAMQLLEQSGESEVFANLKKNSVKVKFYNLSGYGNVYATNSYDPSGRRVILINSTYANAPVEQIACLIAHESMHVLKKADTSGRNYCYTKGSCYMGKIKKSFCNISSIKINKKIRQTC